MSRDVAFLKEYYAAVHDDWRKLIAAAERNKKAVLHIGHKVRAHRVSEAPERLEDNLSVGITATPLLEEVTVESATRKVFTLAKDFRGQVHLLGGKRSNKRSSLLEKDEGDSDESDQDRKEDSPPSNPYKRRKYSGRKTKTEEEIKKEKEEFIRKHHICKACFFKGACTVKNCPKKHRPSDKAWKKIPHSEISFWEKGRTITLKRPSGIPFIPYRK